MRRYFKTTLILVFLVVYKHCSAQSLKVIFTDLGKTKTYKISSIKCNDSLLIEKALSNCLIPFYSKGYLAAAIDTFCCDSINFHATGRIGIRYRWAKLIPDSASNVILNDAGIKVRKLSGKFTNPKLFVRYIHSTINQLEDIGYPFARVKLDEVNINKNTISALVKIDKGSRITIDTIYIKGDVRVSRKKIDGLVNLKRGELYSESKIRRIDQRLKQQPYLNIIKPTEVEFLSCKARVYCYISNRAASRFWGLAGFYTDKTDGKIKLNGDLNLSLVNSLKKGEKVNFTWSAPGKGTQNLNINTDWPYIFGWQVGAIGSLSLYRHDSTYITFNPKLSFSFYATNGARFLMNLDYKKTSYTSNSQLQQAQYGNISALLYGFGYEFCSYNNLALPSRGLLFKCNVNTGTRNFFKGSSPKSNLIDGELFFEDFIPLYENRFILALVSNSKVRAIYSTKGSKTLFENEMFRIGGMGTVRGFNQEAVLSSVYSIATVELHLRTSQSSGIYLYADKGYVKSYELGYSNDNWPLGVGVGLNVATKVGLFNLSYALGQGFGQILGLKDAKVHFGISTTF